MLRVLAVLFCLFSSTTAFADTTTITANLADLLSTHDSLAVGAYTFSNFRTSDEVGSAQVVIQGSTQSAHLSFSDVVWTGGPLQYFQVATHGFGVGFDVVGPIDFAIAAGGVFDDQITGHVSLGRTRSSSVLSERMGSSTT